MINRRVVLFGSLAALCFTQGCNRSSVKVIGGGFQGGWGSNSLVVGNEDTARNAELHDMIVKGPGAAVNARARNGSIIGVGCATGADCEFTDVSGQYAATQARLRHISAEGYGCLEYADAERGAFLGRYAGHSSWTRDSSAVGDSALSGAVVTNCTAQGRNAGAMAEGEGLVFIGDNVTTARIPGEQLPVTDILVGDPDTPWIVPAHGFGIAGQRVNLFVFGDQMPTNAYTTWSNGSFLPFTILGADEVQYTGDKYAATSRGANVRVARNTCRPVNRIITGSGAIMTCEA